MSIIWVEDQIFGEIVLSQNEAVEPLREEKEEGNWSLVDDHINEQIDQRRTEQIVLRQTSKSTEGKPTKWPKTNEHSTKLRGRALEAKHFPKPANLIFICRMDHCLTLLASNSKIQKKNVIKSFTPHRQKFQSANTTESKTSCPQQRNKIYCSCGSESHNILMGRLYDGLVSQ